MLTDYAMKSIWHIAKADFLQRVRSRYFLIGIGVCIFIIYSFVPPIGAGYTIVSLGNYRGLYNPAWIGGMVAMCVPFFTLIGFYIINNAVKRDVDTGVGQIIATTRLGSMQYLSGKFLSNFAVLLLMVAVIAVMTVVMFFARGETSDPEFGNLLLPLFILTVPSMFILSAIALFFESTHRFSRGFINIAYFFFWVFLVSSSLWSQYTDVYGVNTCILQIKDSIAAAHADWNGAFGTGIIITDSTGITKLFTWDGMNWTAGIILQRVFWMCASFGPVVLSSLWFGRFDTPETTEKKKGKSWFAKEKQTEIISGDMPLHIKYRELPSATASFSFIALTSAELHLMLRGRSLLWLVFTAGFWIASAFAPMEFAHRYALPVLWFLQIMIISNLGSRETTNRCNEYIFSCAYPLRRQLPSSLSAAALITMSAALPILIRLFAGGDYYGVYAVISGALFIPAFAMASGIITGGSKLFEVVFTIMTYCALNGIPVFDLSGFLKESHALGLAHYVMMITVALTIAAFTGRKIQISHRI